MGMAPTTLASRNIVYIKHTLYIERHMSLTFYER